MSSCVTENCCTMPNQTHIKHYNVIILRVYLLKSCQTEILAKTKWLQELHSDVNSHNYLPGFASALLEVSNVVVGHVAVSVVEHLLQSEYDAF